MMISDVPTMSFGRTVRPKYRVSTKKETINAILLNADAVPYFTMVRHRLRLSWFAHENMPIIIEAYN